MKSKYELEETDIKNPTFHYFDDITRVINRVIDFSDILLDAKLCKGKYENISIYDISYKNFMGLKPLRSMK